MCIRDRAKIAKMEEAQGTFLQNVAAARYTAMAVVELKKLEAQQIKEQQENVDAFKNNASGVTTTVVDDHSVKQTNNNALDANPTISKDASDNSGLTSGFDLNRD